MGKDDPCSSKTKINDPNNCGKKHGSKKRKQIVKVTEEANGQALQEKESVNSSKSFLESSDPSSFSRTKSNSPYPNPTLKFDTPTSGIPIADKVNEKDFQDLLKFKDVPVDAESVRRHLEQEMLNDKLLPKNKKSRQRYVTRPVTDASTDRGKNANVEEDNNDVAQQDVTLVNNKKAVTPLRQGKPSSPTTKVNKNTVKEKTPLTTPTLSSKEPAPPPAKKAKTEVVNPSPATPVEIRQQRVMNSPLIEIQNRSSHSRDISTGPRSNCSGPYDTQTNEYNDANLLKLKVLLLKTRKDLNNLLPRSERDPTLEDEPNNNAKRIEISKEVTTGEMMVLANSRDKKFTFLTHRDKSNIQVDPEYGLLFHPYRMPHKPEPFSKESAKYCYKFVDNTPPYTQQERDFWSKLNMGPPPHDYPKKEADLKPKKAAPTKEYFRRICGGRPRSYSCTTYTDYESLYDRKNRLDKPRPKKSMIIPGQLRYFSRRSKSAEPARLTRSQLIVKFMHRRFNVPNLNMESQPIFSFLRKYGAAKYFQTHTVFWAEYHKLVEKRYAEEGKHFEPPTIFTVTPYQYKRLADTDLAKIHPEPNRFLVKEKDEDKDKDKPKPKVYVKVNSIPWINSFAELLVELFKYNLKPLYSIIKPMHPDLTNHPLIDSAAKSKLKQIAYETFTVKQFFLNLLHKNEEAVLIWENKMKDFIQARCFENRDFGVEGIKDFFPPTFYAKTVPHIPETHRIFLDEQYKWLAQNMVEINEREEKERIKEEKKNKEKMQKLKAKILGLEAQISALEAKIGERIAQGLPPVELSPPLPPKSAKGQQRKRRTIITMGKRKTKKSADKFPPIDQQQNNQKERGRKRKYPDENSPTENSAKIARSVEHEFSPELTSSYFSHNETFVDQSVVSESSAFEHASFDDPIYDQSTMECEKEITKEVSFCQPELSAAATYTCSESKRIICDTFVTKAATKETISVDATFKARKRKKGATIILPLKRKSKIKAVFTSKTQTKDFELKNSYQKEEAAITITAKHEAKAIINLSIKNVDVDIPFVAAEGANEHASEKLPYDILKQIEKVSFTVSSNKRSAPIVELDRQIDETTITQQKEDEKFEDMDIEQQQPAAKKIDIQEIHGKIMAPRDISKRSLSVDSSLKTNVVKDIRCASVDFRISNDEKNFQSMKTPSSDNLGDLNDIQLEPKSGDKESDKTEENPIDAYYRRLSREMEEFDEIDEAVMNGEDDIEPLTGDFKSCFGRNISSVNETSTMSDANELLLQTACDKSQTMSLDKDSSVSQTSEILDIDNEELILSQDTECQSCAQVVFQNESDTAAMEPVTLPVLEIDKNQKKVNEKSAKIIEKNVKAVIPAEFLLSKLTTPLPFDALMGMSLNSQIEKIPAYTKYFTMKDAFNGGQSLQIQQFMRLKDSPYYAFKVKEELVVNCGPIGKRNKYSQAVISQDGDSCKIYDYVNNEWKCRMELTAKNVLQFDKPYGTGRSRIGQHFLPEDGWDYEFLVYRHDFGQLFRPEGLVDAIYCYYTVIGGNLILLFDRDDERFFNLVWAPYLNYFTFHSTDNHEFDKIVLENYNIILDTRDAPKELSINDIDETNIFFRRKQRSESSKRSRSRRERYSIEETASSSGGSSSIYKKGRTYHPSVGGRIPDHSVSSSINESQHDRRTHSNSHGDQRFPGKTNVIEIIKECFRESSPEISDPASQLTVPDPPRSTSSSINEAQDKHDRRSYSNSHSDSRSHDATNVNEKSTSTSGGSSSSPDKPGSASQHSTSSTTGEAQNKPDQRHHHRNYHENTKKNKNCFFRDNRIFDNNDPSLVLPYETFKSQTIKYHRRLLVKKNHTYLLKEHQKLILYYAAILEEKIRKYSNINTIRTEKLIDFPRLMIKLGTCMLFTEQKDQFSIECDDDKTEDKYRIFMGNIITVSLCDALRILTCLLTKKTPCDLNKIIIDFHTGERFKSASSHLKYCKIEPDWRFLDNALALSIFEYSKDTSTMTFFFIRHLINAFKYFELLEQPTKAYIDYYANVFYFNSPIYFAEQILADTMEKFYHYISNKVTNLPKFPPNNSAADFNSILRQNSKLPYSITTGENTFNFKYQYNQNVYNMNIVIPREMFYSEKLNIIPMEIQCQDAHGNDYFMDPIIPRWMFIINKSLFIHPTTYRVLYHTCHFGKVYLFPFDNTDVPNLNNFRHENGRFNVYSLLKSGIPIRVMDIYTQSYLHHSRSPFDNTELTGVHEARQWIRNPALLNDDFNSGLLHSIWKTISIILMARSEKGLLSNDDSNFQTISVDLMRRFRLYEFKLEENLRIFIPNAPKTRRPTFVPVHNFNLKTNLNHSVAP